VLDTTNNFVDTEDKKNILM